MRILLAEDDERLGQITKELLTFENCSVEWVKNGAEALACFEDNMLNVFDVVVLDWMLPELDGLSVCKILRRKFNFQGGIVFVTARGDEDDCVKALDSGADDYVVKPFKIKELIARVRAVERRKAKPFVDSVFMRDGIVLNKNLLTVQTAHASVNLRKKEFQIFSLLFTNFNRVLPRDTIFDKVWQDSLDINLETLDAHIYNLRKKLKNSLPDLRIRLVKNIGYVLEYNPDCSEVNHDK